MERSFFRITSTGEINAYYISLISSIKLEYCNKSLSSLSHDNNSSAFQPKIRKIHVWQIHESLDLILVGRLQREVGYLENQLCLTSSCPIAIVDTPENVHQIGCGQC